MNRGIFTAVVLLLAGVFNPSIGFYIQPEPIFFTLEPETQLACEGCSVEFTCEIPIQATAAELPAPALGWTVNGTVVSEAFDQSEFTFTSQSDSSSIRSTLRIVAGQNEHAGMYRCVVTDGHIASECKIHACIPTMTLSRAANLTILGNATASEMVALSKNGSVFLSCGAEDYLPSAPQSWKKDGVEVVEKSGLTLLPSGGLLIASSSNSSDATGLYQCTVAFPLAGGQNVTVASYNVQHREEMEPLNPELEVVTSSPHAIESHPFELICVVHNFYPDEISWTKDGVPISAGSGIGLVLNEGALLFDSLEVSDSGTYCCQVPAGDVEQVLERCTELTVVGTPILSSIHNGTTILLESQTEHSTISLDCSVTVNSFQIVTWFWNGELVNETLGGNSTGTLELRASNAAQLFGIYQCFASSPAGSSAILVRVLPLGVSNPPSAASIEEIPIANTFTNPLRVTLRFTWRPPYYTGGLNQLFYRISYIAKFNTVETLCTNLTEAVGYTEYPITSRASVAVVNSVLENTCPELLSEETASTQFIRGICSNEVLFPPEILVSCEGSVFTIEWHNNQLNKEIYGTEADSQVFSFLGNCTYGNMSQPYIITDIPGPAVGAIDGNAAGTMCSFVAAALPPESNREANKQKCYDLDAIQFTEVMECLIVANVSIEFSEYIVMEGSGQATVCVVANGFGFAVSLHTMFSGIAGVDDFSETHVNLTIASLSDNVTCVSIPIKNDLAIEEPLETFSVVLSSNDPNVVITQEVASISVQDDDFAIIGFEQENYTVNEEAGSVAVCATVEEGSRHLERDVTVDLSMLNGTAFGGTDFTMVTKTLVFSDTAKIQCVEIEIRDDQVVDFETRSFSVLLNSTDPAVVMSLDITTVEIEDNDRAVIGFEQDIYLVDEDAGTVQVCAEVKEQSDGLNRDVNIELSAENGTALDGRDFYAVLEILTFNATTVKQCTIIEIVDDLIEDSESKSFTVILTATDAAVHLSPNETTVTIEDNDRIASIRGSTITATVAVMVSFFLVVAVIAVFAAIGFLSYKNRRKKQEETRLIQYTLGRLVNEEYCGYMKAAIDPETYIVDPSMPAFSGRESEEEKFCPLVKKSLKETETRENPQQRESATLRVDPGREQKPPIEIQLDSCGESASFDDADLRNARNNSSSGISVTSSEYVRICPSDFCAHDYTGRTCDSGLGLSLKDVLVAPPTVVSKTNVVQTESDCKNDSKCDASLSQSDAVQPLKMHSSTHQLDSDNAERSKKEAVF